MEKYNINEFNDFLAQDVSDHDIIDYFINLNNQYTDAKTKDELTDDIMYDLTKFWLDVSKTYGEDIVMILASHWGVNPPEVIAAIIDYMPKYYETTYNEYIKKFDKIEIKETDLLFDEIWDREVRAELDYSYLDYDEDVYYDKSLVLPKKDRDSIKYNFKLELATIIYNRGTLFIRLFSGRGKFEVVSIEVNGDGIWRCLKKSEIEETYDLGEDERVISFNCEHCLRKNKEGNVIYFDF